MRTYTPMTINRLGTHLGEVADADRRWLLLLEVLEEFEQGQPGPELSSDHPAASLGT